MIDEKVSEMHFKIQLNKIPNGWKYVQLSDVSVINPKIPNKEEIQDDLEVQFLPMRLVEELNGRIHLSETRRYGDVKKGYTPFINGDLIIAKVTPCMENGKVAIVEKLKNNIGFGSSEFHVIRCKEELQNKFLFYYLLQEKFRNDAEHAMTGAVGLRRVPKIFIERYLLPLPPVDDQSRIIYKIEELYSELDKGVEELKKAQEQLKVYRQAVLKWAFEGKLTNEDVRDGELPEGWTWKRLDSVCSKIQDGSHFSPQKQYSEPGKERYLYITAKNIRNNYMDMSKLTYVDKEFHDTIYVRCNPEFGDVLLTKDGVNTGEVTLNTIHEPLVYFQVFAFSKQKRIN
jgi:type I restriction enzyme, S subunit